MLPINWPARKNKQRRGRSSENNQGVKKLPERNYKMHLKIFSTHLVERKMLYCESSIKLRGGGLIQFWTLQTELIRDGAY